MDVVVAVETTIGGPGILAVGDVSAIVEIIDVFGDDDTDAGGVVVVDGLGG